ncbi:MAG: DUF5654 family protein [Candidatus Aenigmatarchaeota archaeon]
MPKFEQAAAEFRVKEVIIGTITAALGFVTAFVWRDAIQETINTLVPPGQGLAYTYLAAVLVTIVAMVVVYVLYRIQRANIVPDILEEKLREERRRIKRKVLRKKK